MPDAMKMYQIGRDGGRPKPGHIGAAPEWFYKGTGAILHAHNNTLEVPNHGYDGGDEAEIAGCYLIDPEGRIAKIYLSASASRNSVEVIEDLKKMKGF